MKNNNIICGIYKIENKINGQVYIGLSKDIEQRWYQHYQRYNKEGDKEYDKALYRAMRKYGFDNFDFTIIQECPEEKLVDEEIYWISYYDSYENGYNETPGGDVGNICVGENHPNHSLTEADVIQIRTYYKNKARKKDIYSLYKNRIGKSGFDKVWKGETWTHIMMDVYTPELKEFHKHNTANSGTSNGMSKLTENDVRAIRIRRKNGENWKEVWKDYPQMNKGGFESVWYGNTWKNVIV